MSIEHSSVLRSGLALMTALGMGMGMGMGGVAAAPAVAAEGAKTDQIIVRLRDDVAGRMNTTQQRSAIESIAMRAGEGLAYRRDHGGGVHTLHLGRRLAEGDVQTIAARLAADPRVAYAEPDAILRHMAVPNDSLYGEQWNYMAVSTENYGANLPAAWEFERGDPGIVVAVIDTGYRPHADLAGRFVQGYDFVDLDYDGLNYFPASANDGDGRDADAQDPGDWVSEAENAGGWFAGCGASNSSWHGTHVAGTIGAVSNNASGVAGVNWNSKILPVRVLGKCGGYTSDIIDGMRWAAGLSVSGAPANTHPARVINMSLGGPGACTTTFQNTINEIVAQNVVLVVAAGNEGTDAANSRPGSCANVITVAASTRSGGLAAYSNYGSVLEIAAPGGYGSSKILSTLNTGRTTPEADSYVAYQGTSMATPHVAGIVSLLLSVDPCLTPSQIVTLLQSTVTSFAGGSMCSPAYCGAGIVNAGAAVAAARAGLAARTSAADAQPMLSRPQLTLPYAVVVPGVFRDWSTAKCYTP